MGTMGCLQCRDSDTALIEQKMADNEIEDNATIKLLFLGPGGSGKSTIFKQLQYEYGEGYKDYELMAAKEQINCQIISQMKDAITEYLSEPLEGGILKEHIERIKKYEYIHEQMIGADIAESIEYIYQNHARLDGIFANHHKKKILVESTQYFWENLSRIARPDYVPTRQDIINVRFQSTGILEKKLAIDNLHFNIFDLGGQKSERRKWMKCFGGVDAVVFVVSLSCYNEVMFEDTSTTQMEDAMQLFGDTLNHKEFIKTPIILLLNKTDLFAKKKIKDLPITIDPLFEDLDGNNAHDFGQTTAFIKKKFESVNSRLSQDRILYVHLTCAMDNKNVRNVFESVKQIMLEQMRKAMQKVQLL